MRSRSHASRHVLTLVPAAFALFAALAYGQTGGFEHPPAFATRWFGGGLEAMRLDDGLCPPRSRPSGAAAGTTLPRAGARFRSRPADAGGPGAAADRRRTRLSPTRASSARAEARTQTFAQRRAGREQRAASRSSRRPAAPGVRSIKRSRLVMSRGARRLPAKARERRPPGCDHASQSAPRVGTAGAFARRLQARHRDRRSASRAPRESTRRS